MVLEYGINHEFEKGPGAPPPPPMGNEKKFWL